MLLETHVDFFQSPVGLIGEICVDVARLIPNGEAYVRGWEDRRGRDEAFRRARDRSAGSLTPRALEFDINQSFGGKAR